jgi:hypothetical protein
VTIVASTFELPIMDVDLKGVSAPIKWDTRQNRILQSILVGIEQARLNLGTIQTDADLTTDDDEE